MSKINLGYKKNGDRKEFVSGLVGVLVIINLDTGKNRTLTPYKRSWEFVDTVYTHNSDYYAEFEEVFIDKNLLNFKYRSPYGLIHNCEFKYIFEDDKITGFIPSPLPQTENLMKAIIKNYNCQWSTDGLYFFIWYVWNHDKSYGTSIFCYTSSINGHPQFIMRKELLMFNVQNMIIDTFNIIVFGVGQRFPGKEVRIGKIHYRKETSLVNKDFIIINSFDEENKVESFEVHNIIFSKIVASILYAAIYTISSKDSVTSVKNLFHYLRIENISGDLLIPLSLKPINISFSRGGALIAIVFENSQTEIYNILGQKINTISGQGTF
jgi:hypothetical protein